MSREIQEELVKKEQIGSKYVAWKILNNTESEQFEILLREIKEDRITQKGILCSLHSSVDAIIILLLFSLPIL